MEIKITRKTWESIPALEKWGIKEDEFRYNKSVSINLYRHPKDTLVALKKIFESNPSTRGAKTIARDIEVWLDVSNDKSKAAKAIGRTLVQVCRLLIEYIRETPRQHLYKRIQENEGVILCYFVTEIKYFPAETNRDYRHPAYIVVSLAYEEFGIVHTSSFSIQETFLGYSAREILEKSGYSIETPILRDDYESYLEEYIDTFQRIGTQYLAVGIADDSGIDGNEKAGRDSWWTRSRGIKLNLDKNGEPAKVVIDVFQEDDNEDRRKDKPIYGYFWTSDERKNKTKIEKSDDDDVDASGSELAYDDDETSVIIKKDVEAVDIPIHPYVACFDLARHKRLRIHIQNLTRYVYDKSIRDRLVLPVRNSRLIDTLLVDKTSKFTDVVRGKSGGTIILCQGPPGTGKTLTAEIYAEALERPLFTVQCSQLGVDLDELESNLMKVLARGRRWGAIMLLDEADVYVHQRGSDLTQNAIVGVFLRVLEYHSGVLFLTTNRGDLVDDAILSRCTARVPYGVPAIEDQRKIWSNLAVANQVDITAEEIEGIVQCHNRCSGRDIKNLLKLAVMVVRDSGGRINAELITEMTLFKPTTNFE